LKTVRLLVKYGTRVFFLHVLKFRSSQLNNFDLTAQAEYTENFSIYHSAFCLSFSSSVFSACPVKCEATSLGMSLWLNFFMRLLRLSSFALTPLSRLRRIKRRTRRARNDIGCGELYFSLLTFYSCLNSRDQTLFYAYFCDQTFAKVSYLGSDLAFCTIRLLSSGIFDASLAIELSLPDNKPRGGVFSFAFLLCFSIQGTVLILKLFSILIPRSNTCDATNHLDILFYSKVFLLPFPLFVFLYVSVV